VVGTIIRVRRLAIGATTAFVALVVAAAGWLVARDGFPTAPVRQSGRVRPRDRATYDGSGPHARDAQVVGRVTARIVRRWSKPSKSLGLVV
jgi:hypothetical protein